MTLKALSFDVDGTLFDLRQMQRAFAWSAIRHARYLRAFLKTREEVRALGTLPDVRAEQDRRVAAALGVSVEHAKALRERVIERDWIACFRKVKPIPGVREALAAFADRGLKLITVSDYPAEAKLKSMGLDHVRWDADVGAEALGALKPHPRAFEEGIRRLGLSPGEILHVGDRLDADVAGARRVGMRAALFTGANPSTYPAPAGSESPELVFGDYRELARHLGIDV